jgi:tRNA pseudouridine38-40 synthase
MALYQIKIAYDGTHFFGFQRQGNVRTVQLEIENVLYQLDWEGTSILAAGRTDTGVHASGQVISFQLDWSHGCEAMLKAMNAKLPEDIAVNAVKVADDNFHPRYDALSRCYHYHIYLQSHRDPLKDRYAWCVWPAVSIDTIEKASKLLLGTHNFSAFGTPPRKGGHTIRTIITSEWLQTGTDEWVYKIRANAFLYHMVRKLVFLQVKIGQGYWTEEKFIQGIFSQFPQMSGLAKPNGLNLFEVQYQKSE